MSFFALFLTSPSVHFIHVRKIINSNLTWQAQTFLLTYLEHAKIINLPMPSRCVTMLEVWQTLRDSMSLTIIYLYTCIDIWTWHLSIFLPYYASERKKEREKERGREGCYFRALDSGGKTERNKIQRSKELWEELKNYGTPFSPKLLFIIKTLIDQLS